MASWVTSGVRFWVPIFICFILCSSSDVGSSSNVTDKLALLEFKNKITDDQFKIMSLWNATVHFCEWYGVTCGTRHRRVTQINLVSLKLGGTITPHIGNLSFLRTLLLADNNLFHQIPEQIGSLRRLQVLDLSNNTLGSEIPPSFSNCSNLLSLSLSNNKLDGRIPVQLCSLSKLQLFYASKNNLVGTLPPSLGNLTSLKALILSYNNLSGGVPQDLGNLKQLTTLGLGANNFIGEVPCSIYNLSSLGKLEFTFNKLHGSLPWNLFHTLPNLRFISFQGNEFDGRIPVSLSNASDLQILQLAMNKFSGKVPSLHRLNMLRSCLIYTNQLGSGDLAAQDDLSFLCSLTNATFLRWLSMDTNMFGGTLPDCIANLSSTLSSFTLYDQYISGSIPTNIDNLIGLDTLAFENNSFTGIIPPTIGNLKNLVILVLWGNRFSSRIPASLGNLSQLSHLDLSYNSLEGTIPSTLQKCTFLQFLSLGHNNLTGFIPVQILTIPSLSLILSLSHNKLNGTLPDEVGKLTNLYMFDVSSNMISGKIPNSFGECTSMQILYLGGNNLDGHIPSSLSSMKGLQAIDLSSNNLSGRIPEFFTSFTGLIWLNLSFNHFEGVVPMKGVFANATGAFLYGNNKLCGGIPDLHLQKCITSVERHRKRFSTKAMVVVGILAGLACVLLLVYFFGLRRKKAQNVDEVVVAPSEKQPLQFLSYGDLYRATNGFSEGNLVGAGSFGHVYKGVLREGEVVAIKVLNLMHKGASKTFVAECEALRNIRHRNLVKLLTVCSGIDYQGNEFKALVYEFMPNGSLENWLHQPTKISEQDPSRKLGLLERLSIAIDVASLLEYVHHECGAPLVHCDIKPSNILLDGDLVAHVSDFGLAKFLSDSGIIHTSVHPSSSIGVRGTVGYAPPEYGLGSEVSTRGDVYSYGILMLEMLTGKRPTHEMFKEGLNLHMYAKMSLPSGVVDILDPTLRDLLMSEGSTMNPRRSVRVMECLGLLIEIGVACSHESPAERIDMGTVKTKLKKIKDTLLGGRI